MLIIYSGGMDSTVLLHDLADKRIGYGAKNLKAVSFHYGSKHNDREFEMAAKNCARLGVPYDLIDLPFIATRFKSSLIQSDVAVPDGHYTDESMKSTVVPFRNGIMIAIAAGIAASHGIKTVALANHAGDHAIYPDCREDFAHSMCLATQFGAGVSLFAPYTLQSKKWIAERGRVLGVDFLTTWSCYKGREKHCGVCGTCVERKEALAGFDPTEYER